MMTELLRVCGWEMNDLCTPNFWMYSFKPEKVLRMSDPQHFDTILPFLQPLDVPHRMELTIADIEACILLQGRMLNSFILLLMFIRGLVAFLMLLMLHP
jgi:hypothetical protein